MATDLWRLLHSGDEDRTLKLMQEAYAREKDASHALELGNAYLYSRKYEMAYEHFNEFNKHDPTPTDIIYGMAGVAKWCLHDLE
jgi:hypothetical protein